MKRTLHIVDGESSGGSLGGFLAKAQILVWRDVLTMDLSRASSRYTN